MADLADLLHDARLRERAGDLAGALLRYREAVVLAPQRAELWYNAGALSTAQGDHAVAVAAFERAALLRPDWALPHEARGRALVALGDLAAAQAAFEVAVARDPAGTAARVNLALMLNRQGRHALALPQLAAARELAPADEDIWWLHRGTLLLLRRDEAALADFLRFEPHARGGPRFVLAALASARRMGDPVREAKARAAALTLVLRPGESPYLAELLAQIQYHDVAAETIVALYRRYDTLVSAELAAAGETPPVPVARRRPASGDPRLRIGYLSADFRSHVMGELLLPVLAAHDRFSVAIDLFSLAPEANADATTARFKANCDGFVELATQDDRAAAATIAAADLDVLVDLMGHSAFARPGLCARKPARVVLTHLGYHGALGLAAVDAKLTDAIADPPGNEAHLLESLLRLDVAVLPYRPYEAPAAHYERAALDLDATAVVAAAFVPAYKLSPRGLALWRTILERAPALVLLFSPLSDDDRAALARRLEGFGIAAERVRYLPFEPAHRHARYALADLALDTLPYTGGDTTRAALAAGVPVVTRAGLRHAERMGASLLGHAGLAGLVARDDTEYVDLAVRLATDADERAHWRLRVREELSQPALSDPGRYARALEAAYERALAERQLLPR